MKNILIIDDDVDICLLLKRFLEKHNYLVDTSHTGAKGLQKLSENKFDLVICDFRLGDTDGREILRSIKALSPEIAVIIITGYSDIKTAVDVLKLGAFDYVTKPLIPDEILNLVEKAIANPGHNNTSRAFATGGSVSAAGSADEEFLDGESAESIDMFNQIRVIAPTNYSVILYGESGTGKEVVARRIHSLSERKSQPFIAMDCGTLTRELAGSELFGHEKGAFTGAIASKTGHFELAHRGTLFLDEVGNLPYDVQVAMLRVIQERKIKRVGGTKEIDVDVRIIVASNENLQDAYKQGKFREDLYHRFNEFSIHIPPLRNRREEVIEFANFFLHKVNQELNKDILGFDDAVMERFAEYSWPGNLRELRNIVRRAVLLTNKGFVQLSALPYELQHYSPQNEPVINNGEVLERKAPEHNLKAASIEAERETIRRVLKEVNYNKTKAAKVLDIDRKTLYNKIKNFNL